MIEAVSRREVLIALARAGMLNPERSLDVRQSSDESLRQLVQDWQCPPPVRQAAGLPLLRTGRGARMPEAEVVRQVHLHLQLLGLPAEPVIWVSEYESRGVQLSQEWEQHLRTVPHGWAVEGLAPRTARLAAFADEPAWKPLVRLIEHNIHPIGLTRSGFALYDPSGSH